LRRHGIANIARVLATDFVFKGIHFRTGDHLLPINSCVGLDERLNPDPLTVDFRREDSVMGVFGAGPHVCPGAALARQEIQIFLEEWLRRIPEFRIKPGTLPIVATGLTHAVRRLDLVWP
jgi:cytochrome P450